jgi:hypothetical protein
LNITEPFNGTWLAAIVNHLGGSLEGDLWRNWAKLLSIDEPVNGTWIEAIARHYEALDTVNGTWIEAIDFNLSDDTPYWEVGYTDDNYIIGTEPYWVLGYTNENEPYWVLGYTDENYTLNNEYYV